jgi:hypothetical protein
MNKHIFITIFTHGRYRILSDYKPSRRSYTLFKTNFNNILLCRPSNTQRGTFFKYKKSLVTYVPLLFPSWGVSQKSIHVYLRRFLPNMTNKTYFIQNFSVYSIYTWSGPILLEKMCLFIEFSFRFGHYFLVPCDAIHNYVSQCSLSLRRIILFSSMYSSAFLLGYRKIKLWREKKCLYTNFYCSRECSVQRQERWRMT